MFKKATSQLLTAGLVISLITPPLLAQGSSGDSTGGGTSGGTTGGGTTGGGTGNAGGGGTGGGSAAGNRTGGNNSGTGGGTGAGITGNNTAGGFGSGGSNTTGFGATGSGLGSGVAGNAGHGAMTQAGQLMQGAIDNLFMLKVAQTNMAEVMQGQLALRKSRNETVRQLAQRLVQEHGMANTVLTQLMTRKGQTLPRHIGATHSAMYDQLNRLGGAQFDRTFMAGQVEGHEATVTLFQQEVAHGQDADVKAYASRYLPAILNHTMMIYTAARNVGAPGIQERPQTLISGAMAAGDMGHMAHGGSLSGTGTAGAGTTGSAFGNGIGNSGTGNTGTGGSGFGGTGTGGGAGGTGAGGTGGTGSTGTGGTNNSGGSGGTGSGGTGNSGGGSGQSR